MKDVLKKGLLVSIPMILVEQAGIYVAGRNAISETYPAIIEDIMLGGFYLFALGIPVCIGLADSRPIKPTLNRMIVIMTAAWGLFLGGGTVASFICLPEYDRVLFDILSRYVFYTITLFPLLVISCIIFAVIGKLILSRKSPEQIADREIGEDK